MKKKPKNKIRVSIITEGSGKIGFGHLTRCLSLYQAFEEKGCSVKFIVNGDLTIKSLLEQTEHEIFNWLTDHLKLFQSLQGTDIVIIDSYLATEELYLKISEFVSLAVYIDDNQRINYPKGIVVNGSINAEKLNYPQKDEIEHLLGSQYIPLRSPFWEVGKKKINPTIKRVMVTFGGDDLRNLTPDTLKILTTHFPHLKKTVIIGKGFGNISKIEQLIDDLTELVYYPNAEKMMEVMFESDFAISAAGQTLYELARVGLPTIAIGVAHNQTHNLENWGEAGFVEVAGFWDDENLNHNILEKIQLIENRKMRTEMCQNGRKSVNGAGANRIAKHSINKYYREKISLRPLQPSDIMNIFDLSNEKEVRKNSFQPEQISFEDHEKWFNKIYTNSDNLFLVISIQGDFAGQVRFDFEGDSATISISIKKSFRGLGLGISFLEESIKYLKNNFPNIRLIKAYIKENNKKSLKLFEKMGFDFQKNVIVKNNNAFEYIYKIRD
ncbi:MAG: UDP-2,4-diacetamido-2,4,6-trideoxy-beta-L-altropyranose hydrolase [Methanobacterium sp.]|jgi:UDP-2,4-diacetamido-2,4,6-trideoxy-beta-L-altropyranose hydrolase